MHRGGFASPQPRTGPGAFGPRPVRPPRPRFNVDAWAAKQADKYIAAQIAAIQESQRLYTEELQRAAQERIRQGQALAQWMQGQNFPGRVQGIYQTAGSDITGYAGGFAGEMRDVANASAAEQTNMVSGTGQEGAVRNEGEGMGNVLYGAYGWSPAKAFAETGAAYASDAALQPAFAAQFAAAEAAEALSEGLAGTKDFALKMAEARAGKQDLISQFREMRQGEASARYKQRFEMLKWQADQHYRNYMLALERGDQKLAQKELALAQRKQRQAEIEANREFGLDVRRENRLTAAAARGGGSGGGRLTPTQKKNAVKDVASAAESIAADVAKAIKAGEWYVGSGPPAPGARQKLANKLFNAYKHLTMGDPAAKKRLKKVIQEVLDAAMKSGASAPATGSSPSYDDYR